MPLMVVSLVGVVVAAGAFSGALDERAAGGPNWLSLAYSHVGGVDLRGGEHRHADLVPRLVRPPGAAGTGDERRRLRRVRDPPGRHRPAGHRPQRHRRWTSP